MKATMKAIYNWWKVLPPQNCRFKQRRVDQTEDKEGKTSVRLKAALANMRAASTEAQIKKCFCSYHSCKLFISPFKESIAVHFWGLPDCSVSQRKRRNAKNSHCAAAFQIKTNLWGSKMLASASWVVVTITSTCEICRFAAGCRS